MMKESRAPRHFIVPISRKRSVTDISMALAMPTTQTRSDRLMSQVCFERSSSIRAWASPEVPAISAVTVSIPFFCKSRFSSLLLASRRLSTRSLLLHTDMRKAMASTMPLVVISERPKRILRLRRLISIALLNGRTISRPPAIWILCVISGP